MTSNGAKRQIQRDENSRWHHYLPLKRFFAWAVNEGYLEQNPIDSIVLKPPDAAPIEPYKPEHIDAFVSHFIKYNRPFSDSRWAILLCITDKIEEDHPCWGLHPFCGIG